MHADEVGVVNPTPETAGTVGVWAVAYPCQYDFPSRTGTAVSFDV